MRKPTIDGGFWFSFALNLALNFEGAIAFAIALACHFAFQIPIWIAWLVLGLWVGGTFLVTLILSLIARGAPSNDSGTGTGKTGTVRFSSHGDGEGFKDESGKP